MRLISEYDIELKKLCKQYYVSSFSLVGSASRSEMTQYNDLDFLVRFDDELPLLDYADNFFGLKKNLEQLFDKNVDLITEKSLKNPILKASIEDSKQLIYEA